MALGFIYDGSNAIIEVNDNADGLEFATRANSLVFHEGNTAPGALTAVYTLARTVPKKYLKRVGSTVQEMTQPEKDAVDAAAAAAIIAAAKSAAKATQTQLDAQARVLRAVVKETVDELNFLRERDRDRSVDVAAATSLADLKTRWAARSALADRTYAQAKTAIDNLVDGE